MNTVPERFGSHSWTTPLWRGRLACFGPSVSPPDCVFCPVLAQGETCVTELAAAEQESLSTISQRLRVLRSENLIVRRRRGKHINYALADQHVMDLVFNALAHATERPASEPSRQTDFEKENLS